MTRCLTCGKGERAGEHDWKTGIAKDGHKFQNDNRPDSEKEFGFKDVFVKREHMAKPNG